MLNKITHRLYPFHYLLFWGMIKDTKTSYCVIHYFKCKGHSPGRLKVLCICLHYPVRAQVIPPPCIMTTSEISEAAFSPLRFYSSTNLSPLFFLRNPCIFSDRLWQGKLCCSVPAQVHVCARVYNENIFP